MYPSMTGDLEVDILRALRQITQSIDRHSRALGPRNAGRCRSASRGGIRPRDEGGPPLRQHHLADETRVSGTENDEVHAGTEVARTPLLGADDTVLPVALRM